MSSDRRIALIVRLLWAPLHNVRGSASSGRGERADVTDLTSDVLSVRSLGPMRCREVGVVPGRCEGRDSMASGAGHASAHVFSVAPQKPIAWRRVCGLTAYPCRRAATKRPDTVGQPPSSENCVSNMPSLKAKKLRKLPRDKVLLEL